ncbi:helix-turn-helix domain-containing protein [Streptomyces sp. LP11]|uniref:Helix-turn-helix domain-containing protein n=1 Tax=Streptomyces pyxinicus TaxID=2970331 RepID=A0ABT2B8P3_9ACTN|nr:helix-turn-helix domain-containing protein [Streptomyces sp. LP11]MCS0604886.1 helix-turn-helix domain-containing protein [Streptomyces sp. LP11]
MHVEHLLQDETLGLRLLWAEEALLRREIGGVTVTDLEDPARFVRPDEVVLSGLVWWSADGGRDKAERFVSGLKDAGAVALLAGEETHGSVPDALVEACERHGVPVAGVPAHVLFRAITDTVYLGQWGELSRRHALPAQVRARLDRLAAEDPDPAAVLAAAFAHVGGAEARVRTAAGRTVATTSAVTPGAAPLPAADGGATEGATLGVADGGVTVPVEAETVTPYERWVLHLPDASVAPPRLLHEIAAVLGRCQDALHRQDSGRRAARELGAALAGAGPAGLSGAVRACGLPGEGPYRVLVADAVPERHGPHETRKDLARGGLTEAVAHTSPAFATVGSLPDGTAFAVVPEESAAAPAEVWPRVAACAPGVLLYGGLSAPVTEPAALPGALAEARYALACARTTAPAASQLADATTLTTLEALLTGVPAEVRAAYSRTVLGPLLDTGSASAAALLHTLEVFLAHDGSWARTAESLHLHVNTVHYRIQRIEHFTGRDLSRLVDRLDLWAALLCHRDPAGPRAVPGTRRTRPSAVAARRS